MGRSAPIYLLAFFMFSIMPVGATASWMANVERFSPYSGYVFFLMILFALAAIVLVPFATRAFSGKSAS